MGVVPFAKPLDQALFYHVLIGTHHFYHHAAQINVRVSVEDPVFDADTNIIGSINLLQLSVKNEIRKFIFASTGGAIYGEPETISYRRTIQTDRRDRCA